MESQLSEENIKLLYLYNEGYGSTTIAKMLGLSKATIQMRIMRYNRWGISGLEPLPNKEISCSLRYKAVMLVLEKRLSLWQASVECNISKKSIPKWIALYKSGGKEALDFKRPHLKRKKMGRPRKKEPQTELEILRARLEYLEAENALLKKVKALVEERDARLQKIGQRPSKN